LLLTSNTIREKVSRVHWFAIPPFERGVDCGATPNTVKPHSAYQLAECDFPLRKTLQILATKNHQSGFAGFANPFRVGMKMQSLS
jgi:hypothetical protein